MKMLYGAHQPRKAAGSVLGSQTAALLHGQKQVFSDLGFVTFVHLMDRNQVGLEHAAACCIDKLFGVHAMCVA